MTKPRVRVGEMDIEAAPKATFDELNTLSLKHYGISLPALLDDIETPLRRRQFARLLGVMVKLPFSKQKLRPPSTSTKAVYGLEWLSDDKLMSLAPGTWQFEFMRTLTAETKGLRNISDRAALEALTYYKYESKLGKFIFEAFHERICGNPQASAAVKKAIQEARKVGVRVTEPTTIHLSVGLASTVAVAVANVMTPALAAVAAPVIGGVALLLLQIGVDGFCKWSKAVIKEAEDLERSEG